MIVVVMMKLQQESTQKIHVIIQFRIFYLFIFLKGIVKVQIYKSIVHYFVCVKKTWSVTLR
jgi:hypothetical protein